MKGGEGEKKWSKEQLEEAIKKAIRSRVPEFKAKASALTFEGARRVVEQDLRMKRFSLDAHKKFVKHCMEECLNTDGGEKTPEPSGSPTKAEKSTIEEPEETQNTSTLKNNSASNFDETHASYTETRNEGNEVSEDMIKEAIKNRVSFFKKHSETITLMKVRRLLEEDLNLSIKALDVHKAFISMELEKVLTSLEMNKSENGVQKKPKKASQKVEKRQATKTSKRTHDSDSSDNAIKEEERSDEEVEPKRRKQVASKVKASTKNSTTQKNSVEKKKPIASSKSKKIAKNEREDNSDEGREGGDSSDKNETRSSDEEEDTEKKREKQTPQVYGKKVEHLKSIIKSCGLSIPPAVYRRAKQAAPEDKREAFLIKELEEILQKEGLSTNPSEKEIKEVRKRKERAKELEGIDMSNIITSSRRRSSAFSYIPPPKPPKLELSSDDDDNEDDEDDDDDDVDLEKGDANDDDDDGDVNDSGDHGGDEGNDNGDVNDGGNDGKDEGNDDDVDKGKGSGQDGGDDNH